MSKSKWSAEKTWKFVVEYKLRECLWNSKLQTYKDRQVKDAAYTELAEMFGCGVNDVKVKIKNLRTTYIQEHKKIQESTKLHIFNGRGTIYVPSLVWYKEMDSFLHYSSVGKITPIIDAKIPELMEDTRDMYIKEESYEGSLDNSEFIDVSESCQSNYEGSGHKEENTHQKTTSKKRKHSDLYNTQSTTDSSQINETFEENEFDIFGKSVAKQLKSFSSIAAALRVQSKIQTLLTETRIQDQIAASDGNMHFSSGNKRFFYNQSSSESTWSNSNATTTEVISVMLPSTTLNSMSDESSTTPSLLEDSKEFEVSFLN